MLVSSFRTPLFSGRIPGSGPGRDPGTCKSPWGWLYGMLPFSVDYVPYTGAHVLQQLQLLGFGGLGLYAALHFGLYPAEARSINLDVDWVYRKLGSAACSFLDWSLNGVNALAEEGMRAFARGLGRAVQAFPVSFLMFFGVNIWLLMGLTGRKLEMKKRMLVRDMRAGTMPIGFGAGIATLFIFVVYIMT